MLRPQEAVRDHNAVLRQRVSNRVLAIAGHDHREMRMLIVHLWTWEADQGDGDDTERTVVVRNDFSCHATNESTLTLDDYQNDCFDHCPNGERWLLHSIDWKCLVFGESDWMMRISLESGVNNREIYYNIECARILVVNMPRKRDSRIDSWSYPPIYGAP